MADIFDFYYSRLLFGFALNEKEWTKAKDVPQTT
jgi:hypothetical protein